MSNIDNEFLGKKKLHIEELSKLNKLNTKKAKPEAVNSDSNSDSDSDDELKTYKNITSGKINIKNVLSNRNIPEDDKEKKLQNEKNKSLNNIKPSEQSKQSHNFLTNKLLNLLPAPKRNLKDKLTIVPNQNIEKLSDKFKSLANPDLIMTDSNLNNNFSPIVNLVNKNNMLDLNVNELTDSNWEAKYISTLHNEELESNVEEPSRDQRNKNHIKSLIHDYKKQNLVNKTSVNKK